MIRNMSDMLGNLKSGLYLEVSYIRKLINDNIFGNYYQDDLDWLSTTFFTGEGNYVFLQTYQIVWIFSV